MHSARNGEPLAPRIASPWKAFLAAALASAGGWLVGAAPDDPPPGQGISVGAPAQPVTPPPLPGGPAPDLAIVFTDQVVGYVEPCG